MNPILYEPGATNFEHNGIGILTDAVSCEVLMELNGQYELEMQYPVDGIHFSDIALECRLKAKADPVSELQIFEIYRITKPLSGLVTVYARHIAYLQRGITISPFTAASCAEALTGLKTNAAVENPFEYWTDKTTAGTMTVAVPTTVWTQLGSSEGCILDVFGGEYEFDNFTVKLWESRGADRGVSIRYGKNLTSLEQDANCAEVYTGVHPYWADSDGNVVELPGKVVRSSGTYPAERILPVDLSDEFEEAPNTYALILAAGNYMREHNIGVPVISWTIEFQQLEQTEEYRGTGLLEYILLGDTVSVEFALLGVSGSARAVSARYDSLLERYNSVTLGSVKRTLSGSLARQEQMMTTLKNQVNYYKKLQSTTLKTE